MCTYYSGPEAHALPLHYLHCVQHPAPHCSLPPAASCMKQFHLILLVTLITWHQSGFKGEAGNIGWFNMLRIKLLLRTVTLMMILWWLWPKGRKQIKCGEAMGVVMGVVVNVGENIKLLCRKFACNASIIRLLCQHHLATPHQPRIQGYVASSLSS